MRNKLLTIILAASMATGISACSRETADTEAQTQTETLIEATTDETEAPIGMPNPWTEASTMDEAAEGAGVGSLIFTEDGTSTPAGTLVWYGYRYTNGIAEVNGAIGAAELTVRKGLSSIGDISGDYNAYDYTWELAVDGITVNCSGNIEGQAMLMTWTRGDYSYSIMVRGQGDLYDTYGLQSDTIEPLVSQWIS